MTAPLRIGIAGLGTVGAGVVKILLTHGHDIARRAGRPIAISAVSARDIKKDRGVDLGEYRWVHNPADLVEADDIDVIVELIGGEEGAARALVTDSLRRKKHVVTANKALLARHGAELARISDEFGACLLFEASVAGGIPVIKALREGFAGNDILKIKGILNGTSNYILTEMRQTGRPFEDVLQDAQRKGYAEADPTFDIDGTDAAHKLSILTSLAFGVLPDFGAMDIRGIRNITAGDIEFARELGFKIKLLGIAERRGDIIAQSMEPCLVPETSALASVEGVFNAISISGDFVGRAMLEGRGAGAGPTASAVMADLIDLARGISMPAFGVPAASLKQANWAGPDSIVRQYYIRLTVRDEPGVISDTSSILRDLHISIESMIQRGRDPGQPVSVVITTHECSQAAIRTAAKLMGSLPSVLETPTVIRIEDAA